MVVEERGIRGSQTQKKKKKVRYNTKKKLRKVGNRPKNEKLDE